MIEKKIKEKRCKAPGCSSGFTPRRPMQKGCCYECEVKLGLIAAEKSKKKREQSERRGTKAKLDKLKTRSQYMKEAQVAWNFYVRMRDLGRPCASCGAMPEQKYGGTMDCSHYRSVGAAPHLRFHLHNAAAACVKCNRHLSGNIAALRVGMIERIGIEKVEAIECNNETRKFDIEYLKRIKTIFTKKVNRKKKELFGG